jgi:hypothetical protein
MNRYRVWLIALVPMLLCCAALRAEEAAKPKNEIDPEAEKELKAMGFTEIKGSWRRVKKNIYEVTDGKLESAKTDGTLAFTIDANAKGSLNAYCRNSFEAKEYVLPGANNLSTRITSVTGFGVEWLPKKCLVYGPLQIGSGSKPNYIPAHPTELVMHPEEKTQISIGVHDINLDIEINGKPTKKSNYKITKDGPFSLTVKGTLTLEGLTLKD